MPRGLLSVALLAAVASSAVAQDRLVPKQLAGPIGELHTGVMAKAAPIEAAIHSKSAMIPVDLRPMKDGSWRWQGQVAVDGPRVNMVLFSGEESWDLQLAQPHTKSLEPARQLATKLERTSLKMGNTSFEGDHYGFEGVRPGEWTVSVEAAAPRHGKGYLLYSSDTAHRLASYQATGSQLVGGEIGFVAFGYEKSFGEAPIKASSELVTEAVLQVTTPQGRSLHLPMFDDGLHGDGGSGDGVFGASFIAAEAGEYHAQVMASGKTPQGLPFVRSAEHLVPVLAPQVSLSRDYAVARVVDGRRLAVSLAVDNGVDAPEKYRVFAEVWGADELGAMQPVSWIGGMVYVEDGRLDLGLDLGWIGLSKARSDFELRNVRLEDPDTFIPVARQARLSLAMPKLPVAASMAPAALDEQMLMGPRPATAPAKAGSRLLLVHGYCSGNAWGQVAGQFTGESIFLDLDQNRSHDQFANLIGSFGSSYSSYGIVAHSQGGAAALHLYTYYWSGLDNASGGRLIQSVGTPYQGTALAGNAAVLGQVFGIGCGTNNDLTYSGASSWLSGIPSWARGAVNYYTTSFTDKWWRYDYCQIVTDLLLNDPDDGTTERAKGQLSGAVNRGHKTGWCHTDGMRDPNQVRDSSRNSTMNANAAR